MGILVNKEFQNPQLLLRLLECYAKQVLFMNEGKEM